MIIDWLKRHWDIVTIAVIVIVGVVVVLYIVFRPLPGHGPYDITKELRQFLTVSCGTILGLL